MATRIYQMPSNPKEADPLYELLEKSHSIELVIGSTGTPVFALILSNLPLSPKEAQIYEQVLQALKQIGARDTSPPVGCQGSSQVQLQPGLWVDLERFEVRRGQEQVALSAREAEVLSILLRQPRCYVKAEVLAEALGLENEDEPERPVEGIVSQIRRKLGEAPYRSTLIRCKRYAGYAIFPVDGPTSRFSTFPESA